MGFLRKLFGIKERQRSDMEIVWESLQKSPNQEHALEWVHSAIREQWGEEKGIEALTRIASVPGSWRAQLWLGQQAMYSRQPERALAMFRECLEKVSHPAPMSVLADISASLGSSGYFREIEELVEPVFDAKTHTIHVGANLMRAHTEMGQFDKARQILDQLYVARRPQDEKQLQHWTQVLATAESS